MTRTTDQQPLAAWYGPHAGMRADAYVLLASLLNGPPGSEVIGLVRNLTWAVDLSEKMQGALADLQRAGTACTAEGIGEEFRRLFVGLGSGELVPYASWYREKTIQSAPLAAIRADLCRLGIVRRADTFESEDHAGALCEVMALLTAPENEIPVAEQAAFFARHLGPWLPDFFRDLQNVSQAPFYQSAGRFGQCLLEEENGYLHHGGD